MDHNTEINREELEKALEKAKKDLQEQLAKMTPEERREAAARAKEAIKADEAKTQRIIDEARKLMEGSAPTDSPKFCPNCGAPAGEGNFCAFCGGSLKNGK